MSLASKTSFLAVAAVDSVDGDDDVIAVAAAANGLIVVVVALRSRRSLQSRGHWRTAPAKWSSFTYVLHSQ